MNIWVFNYEGVSDEEWGLDGCYGDKPHCVVFAEKGAPMGGIPDCLPSDVYQNIEQAHTAAGVEMEEVMENTFMVSGEKIDALSNALKAEGFEHEPLLLAGRIGNME